MKKMFQKMEYVGKSFRITLEREGLFVVLKRGFYFVLYGKGVASKGELAKYREEMRTRPLHLDLILEMQKERDSAPVNGSEVVDIIIPVYNGRIYVEALLSSLERNTHVPCRLIIIDDCSPDESIWKWLCDWKESHQTWDVVLLRNEKNEGFVRTVNKGVQHAKNHFVILNTDTEVPDGWLDRLMYPIRYEKGVASVTPFTNAGTIFSFPKTPQNNEIPNGCSVDVVDSAFRSLPYASVEVPTGMGFCMAFHKDVVDQIGMFDEKTFGRGYAEENDWSRRAVQAGYKNVMITNLFVYHKHGASFSSDEKQTLVEENLRRLNQKHPGYDRVIQNFINKDPLRAYRELALLYLGKISSGEKGQELIIDHELGGGANLYREEYVKENAFGNRGIFILSYSIREKMFFLKYQWKTYEIRFIFEDILLFPEIVSRFHVTSLVVNQIVSFPDPLGMLRHIVDMKRLRGIRVCHLLHDYFAICPSYTLLNDAGEYCNVPTDLSICESCLLLNDGMFTLYVKEKNIRNWRMAWSEFLRVADEILCFSHTSRDILLRVYPDLQNVIVRPHTVGYIPTDAGSGKKVQKEPYAPVVIGVLGGINKEKGSKIIRDMVRIIEKDRLNARVVVIGSLVEKIQSDCLAVHGKFAREEIVSLVEKYEVDIFLIPSIWPETFSYTAQEVMQMRYPLAVFNVGAPAERAKEYEKGIIISQLNARAAIQEIMRYANRHILTKK